MFELIKKNPSEDGATRFLWRLNDGNIVDTILLEHENKNCICLPSQVGCGLRCRFCRTGHGGLVRNLDSEELMNLAYDTLEKAQMTGTVEIDRILFNREGEAFCNYKNFLRTCRFLHLYTEFRKTEFLVSTAGLTPWIYKLATDRPNTELWVSLNAPTSYLRNKIMPINKVYGLNQLVTACSYYARESGRKVRLNYIMIESVNDSKFCAAELARLIIGKPFRLQIAQMNPFAGYRNPSKERIHSFLSVLEDFGIEPEYFQSKGATIGAGCGQAKARKPLSVKVIE